MAVEYVFEAEAVVGAPELFDFFARTTGAETVDRGDPFLRREGLDISPYVIDPESPQEQDNRVSGQPFETRVRVFFRLHKTDDDEVEQRALSAMVSAVLAFFAAYPGDGMLLHNQEQVILSRQGGELGFDTWEGIDEEPALLAFAETYPRRELPQPYL